MNFGKFHSSINVNKVVFFISQNKVDLLILNFLGFITIFTSIFLLQNHAEFMYDIDSYRYYFLAKTSNDNVVGSSQSFVNFLTLMIEIAPQSDQLLFVRTISTIFTVQLVVFIYLIGRKIFNPFFATAGSLLVSFSPILTSYSVTLHNDIFALAMCFTALFFMIKPRSINLIIAGILLLIAGLTRVDTTLLFILPFIITISYFASKKIRVRFFYLFVIGLLIFSVGGFLFSQNVDIYSSRFSTTERLTLFLNYDTINTVWEKASNITQSELLNTIFSNVLFVCAIIFLVNFRKKILRFFTSMGDNFNSRKIAAFYLTIIFLISILSASTLHILYSIDEEGLLIIHEKIIERYVLPTQILLLFGFTLVFSIFSAAQFLVNRLKDKAFKEKKIWD